MTITAVICDGSEKELLQTCEMLRSTARDLQLDMKIYPFSDCGSCKKFLQQHGADLLVTEMEFEGGSGLDMVRALRSSGKNTAFRLVFLTGVNCMAAETYAVHTDDYLLKPLNRDKLLRALGKCGFICLQ